ncbi:hypothetical protein F2Q69_00011698 [Brassica cretica]|uniref:Uncharacterized protein n=1 Tax=Brassica cretica TaxID=69181 RepID=A0A8S9R2G2_BRACR|nr:hypothetical protein F2Q69_00011698 [Brassica cretica]
MWRAERAHSARPMATWITPRASLSSLDRTAFRFVSIGLSVEILRRKQVSSTNRDCPHQLAVWRAERAHSARPMAMGEDFLDSEFFALRNFRLYSRQVRDPGPLGN